MLSRRMHQLWIVPQGCIVSPSWSAWVRCVRACIVQVRPSLVVSSAPEPGEVLWENLQVDDEHEARVESYLTVCTHGLTHSARPLTHGLTHSARPLTCIVAFFTLTALCCACCRSLRWLSSPLVSLWSVRPHACTRPYARPCPHTPFMLCACSMGMDSSLQRAHIQPFIHTQGPWSMRTCACH
jgi:hypothetical protein